MIEGRRDPQIGLNHTSQPIRMAPGISPPAIFGASRNYPTGTNRVKVICAAISELDDARESFFYKVALGRLEAILAVFCRVDSWRVLEIRNKWLKT